MAQSDQIWYLLLSDLTLQDSSRSNGSKALYRGELLLTFSSKSESSTSNSIEVQPINYPNEVLRCNREYLMYLNDEDVKWLRSINAPSARFELVKVRTKAVWNKRQLLTKGRKISFFRSTKITGTIQKQKFQRGTEGYLLEVKVDQQHRATGATTTDITLADVYSIDETSHESGEELDLARESATNISKHLPKKHPSEIPNVASLSPGKEEQQLGELSKQWLRQHWRSLINSESTLDLLNAFEDNSLLSLEEASLIRRQNEKGRARLLILHLLQLPEGTLEAVSPLVTATIPIILLLYEQPIEQKALPEDLPLDFDKTKSWLNLKVNRMLLERAPDFDSLMDTFFEREAVSEDAMNKMCQMVSVPLKVDCFISDMERASEKCWKIFLQQIKTNVPDLYSRVIIGNSREELQSSTEASGNTSYASSSSSFIHNSGHKLFTNNILSLDDWSKFKILSSDEEKENFILKVLSRQDLKPEILSEGLKILRELHFEELATKVESLCLIPEDALPPRPVREKDAEFSQTKEDNSTHIRTPKEPGNSYPVPGKAKRMKQPVTLPLDKPYNGFTVGSKVELDDNKTGVIKWIGYVDDRQNSLIAGLEMDGEMLGTTDDTSGTLNGFEMFNCEPGRRQFIALEKCKLRKAHKGQSPDCEVAESGNSPELKQVSAYFPGQMQGVQGEGNSSYLDATLFCVFAFDDSLDFIFDKLNDEEFKQLETRSTPYSILSHLKEKIVNSLRGNEVVGLSQIKKLRQLQNKLCGIRGKDEELVPENFIQVLLQYVVRAEPFLHFRSKKTSFILDVTADRDMLHIPTTQRLIDASCMENNTELEKVTRCLILKLPRSEKTKLYNKIYASPRISIKEGPKRCILCNEVATRKCEKCSKILIDKHQTSTLFCDHCCDKRHKHKSREDHDCGKLYPPVSGDIVANEMELFAVLCVNEGHYIAFVRSGKRDNSPWVFFDSMPTKIDDLPYIPEVRECSALSNWLTEEGYQALVAGAELDKDLQRFFEDSYMCFYRPI